MKAEVNEISLKPITRSSLNSVIHQTQYAPIYRSRQCSHCKRPGMKNRQEPRSQNMARLKDFFIFPFIIAVLITLMRTAEAHNEKDCSEEVRSKNQRQQIHEKIEHRELDFFQLPSFFGQFTRPPLPPPAPSMKPAFIPTSSPSASPTKSVAPSHQPTISFAPSLQPSNSPSEQPSISFAPSARPSDLPSEQPSVSSAPSLRPSTTPSSQPTVSAAPSLRPSSTPSAEPTVSSPPSSQPSAKPSAEPTVSAAPSFRPSSQPSDIPSSQPSDTPSSQPTTSSAPSFQPSAQPSAQPTLSSAPSSRPSTTPSAEPTISSAPSSRPSIAPSAEPTASKAPSAVPTVSKAPSFHPTFPPTLQPTKSHAPSTQPSITSNPTMLTEPKAGNASCSANLGCSGLAGNCCPTDNGTILGCCRITIPETPVPVATPAPVSPPETPGVVPRATPSPVAAPIPTPATKVPVTTFPPFLSTDAPVPTPRPVPQPTITFPPFLPPFFQNEPTFNPSRLPIPQPSALPTASTTKAPRTSSPTKVPTTRSPTKAPITRSPTKVPTTRSPTKVPTTGFPTKAPFPSPAISPSLIPTSNPTKSLTSAPTNSPTGEPTTSKSPTVGPTRRPTSASSSLPTFVSEQPTMIPSLRPSASLTPLPTRMPTRFPTPAPTNFPTGVTSDFPSQAPTNSPTEAPTISPTQEASSFPSDSPSGIPTPSPTLSPSSYPSSAPSSFPSKAPSQIPSTQPTGTPSVVPTISQVPTISLVPSIVPTPVYEFEKLALNTSDVRMEYQLDPRRLQEANTTTASDDQCIELWRTYVRDRIEEEVVLVVPRFETLEVDIFNVDESLTNTSLTFVFDVLIEIRSILTVHDVNRYIEGPFDSQSEKAVFLQYLRNTECEIFARVGALNIAVPRSISNVNEPRTADDTSRSGLIAGLVVAIAAILMLTATFIFVRMRNRRQPTDLNDEEPLFSVAEANLSNEYASEIGVRTNQEVSTLGDPIPPGAARPAADLSTIGSSSLDYDYQRAYLDVRSTAASEVTGGTGTELNDTLDEIQTIEDADDGGGLGNFSLRAGVESDDEDELANHYIAEEQFEVLAPAGVLGLILETNKDDGLPTVNSIKPNSVLADVVKIGDHLISIDGEDVALLSASEASRLIASKKSQPVRKFVFSRPTGQAYNIYDGDGSYRG